ncbi:MAG: PQQ-dependent sugar dehydrogenase [Nitrospiraceae bacterium]
MKVSKAMSSAHVKVATYMLLCSLTLGLAACGGGGDSAPASIPKTSTARTVTIVTPTDNQSLPAGAVDATFSTANFTVRDGAKLKVVLDGTVYYLLNAPDNVVRKEDAAADDVHWTGINSMRFDALSAGAHVLHVEAFDSTGTKLTNPEAQVTRAFFVGVPSSGVPQIIAGDPKEGTTQQYGVVQVNFATVNFAIGELNQPHMRFFVNDDPTPFHFYSGPGVSDENGVLLKGLHYHPIHWKSDNTFEMYNWDNGEYTIRFELVDAQGKPLPNPEASATRHFTWEKVPSGEMRLEEKISGVSTITFEFAPSGDDRIFVSEGKSGNISIIDTSGGQWAKRNTPFYHVDVATDVEQGTFGVALDPNFSSNHFVYLYYTTADGPNGPRNRVIRLTDTGGVGTNETTIIDDLPTAQIHNGGILRFGPDGKLYITVGDGLVEDEVQNMSKTTGKVLRLNPDGSTPPDNPFPGTKFYSIGWRSQFGMTFHPVTNEMWMTENGTAEKDQVDRVLPGRNHGWPVYLGNDLVDPPIVNVGHAIINFPPITTYTPTLGMTGILAIPDSAPYPAPYHNTLLFTNVNTGDIHRLTLTNNYTQLLSDDVVAGGVGALIDLKFGPDGYAYVSGFSTIYKIVVN